MFDPIVQELATRFGLGEQAAPLLRQVLAYASKADHGGLAGFISKFEAAGLGAIASSWLGGAAGAKSISPAQIETVLGHKGGLIAQLTASTGLARHLVTPALGYALPAVVAALSPDGKTTAALSAEVSSFLQGGAAGTLGAIAAQAQKNADLSVGEQLQRWIPWLVVVLLALGLLGWCSQKTPQSVADEGSAHPAPAMVQTDTAAPVVAPVAAASAALSATPAANTTQAPLGAGVLAEFVADKPMLKVYFDVSRAQVAPEFAKVAADIVAYVKDHPEAKLRISGFNDPTGNAAQNAKLSKQRAEAVRAALKTQGVALERMELVKPTDASAAIAAGANNAELRRVEVHVQ